MRTTSLKPFGALFAVTLLAAIVLQGCSSGPPSAKSLARAGDSDYKKQRYDDALQRYTDAQDLHQNAITGSADFADTLTRYQDTQIIVGTRKAEEAAAAGDARTAWLWYTLVSEVNASDERCQQAAARKDEIAGQIADGWSQKAAEAKAQNDNLGAAVNTLKQSLATGGNAQEAIGGNLTPFQPGDEPVLAGTMTVTVQGPVRPDSALRYSTSNAAYAYGIPIFYGDIPVAYERLGELRQAGVPQEYSSVQQRYYAAFDSLSLLSKKAQKQGADALINVNYRKKGRNMVTEAEMIRFTE